MVFEEFDYSIDIINFVVLCIIKFWQVFDAIINDLFVSDFVDIFFIEPFGNKIFKEFLIFVDVVWAINIEFKVFFIKVKIDVTFLPRV